MFQLNANMEKKLNKKKKEKERERERNTLLEFLQDLHPQIQKKIQMKKWLADLSMKQTQRSFFHVKYFQPSEFLLFSSDLFLFRVKHNMISLFQDVSWFLADFIISDAVL